MLSSCYHSHSLILSTHSHHPLINVILFSLMYLSTLCDSLCDSLCFLSAAACAFSSNAHALHQVARAHETSRSCRFKQTLRGAVYPNFHHFNLSPSRSVVSCSNFVFSCIAICDLSLSRVLFFAAIWHLRRARSQHEMPVANHSSQNRWNRSCWLYCQVAEPRIHLERSAHILATSNCLQT